MMLLRTACSKLAMEDLSRYTTMMAFILGVKKLVLACESPVYDRNDWIKSLQDDPSNIQIQKWIFAWLYVRSNYKKLVCQLKDPEESFEERFLEKHGLKYDEDMIKSMKKNTKSSIRLLYNLRARSWRDRMLVQIKEKLSISISLTAPKQIRDDYKNYRRESNTFFIGQIKNDSTTWKEVICLCLKVHIYIIVLI